MYTMPGRKLLFGSPMMRTSPSTTTVFPKELDWAAPGAARVATRAMARRMRGGVMISPGYVELKERPSAYDVV